MQWPDATWGVADQADHLQPDRFARYLDTLPESSVIEVVCHPGDPRPDDPPLTADYGRMRVQSMWRAEFESLRDGGWREMLSAHGARLCGYGQVSSD